MWAQYSDSAGPINTVTFFLETGGGDIIKTQHTDRCQEVQMGRHVIRSALFRSHALRSSPPSAKLK
jgi:hypothetical protein